ncbi:MAG: DUF554 domain-containing protein [Chloroflexota bacterium]|nr:DUF554 domain-containing protein [Chloroflexota bacterium]
MTGTLINITTIIIGSTLGLIFGSRLPERVRQTVVAGLGLFTATIGIQMFLKTENSIIVLGSILIGGILGEWWRIEEKLDNLGGYLETQFSKHANLSPQAAPTPGESVARVRFMKGFLTASLLFCVGPMTILGSIQDGLSGDYKLLAIKSVLDGFASLAFASTLGVGVLFSTLTVLIFQGGISLLAVQAQAVITAPMMNEMTAAGGLLLVGLAISSLLEIKPIRVGNFLPALGLAPLIVGILNSMGIQ